MMNSTLIDPTVGTVPEDAAAANGTSIIRIERKTVFEILKVDCKKLIIIGLKLSR